MSWLISVISQLYPSHEDLDAERVLDSILDGRYRVAKAARRRAMDGSPLARWLNGRANYRPTGGAHHPGRRPPGRLRGADGGAFVDDSKVVA